MVITGNAQSVGFSKKESCPPLVAKMFPGNEKIILSGRSGQLKNVGRCTLFQTEWIQAILLLEEYNRERC